MEPLAIDPLVDGSREGTGCEQLIYQETAILFLSSFASELPSRLNGPIFLYISLRALPYRNVLRNSNIRTVRITHFAHAFHAAALARNNACIQLVTLSSSPYLCAHSIVDTYHYPALPLLGACPLPSSPKIQCRQEIKCETLVFLQNEHIPSLIFVTPME